MTLEFKIAYPLCPLTNLFKQVFMTVTWPTDHHNSKLWKLLGQLQNQVRSLEWTQIIDPENVDIPFTTSADRRATEEY